jgi:hypothetical protein
MHAIFESKIYINSTKNTKFCKFRVYEIRHDLLAACLLLFFFSPSVYCPKDGGNVFLRNIGWIRPD